MFLVMSIKTSMTLSFMGSEVEVPFSRAGFLGMCPVFKTRLEAESWANGEAEIIEVKPAERGER